ncbi:MAG: carbonic anhydrase [Synechococcales bacterium]|nr:carbonic anhydrase [Synechococcales bacterium]
MQRRKVLKLLGMTAVSASLINCVLRAQTAFSSEEIHWGYIGEVGPERWGELSSEYQACAIGSQQTPIDLQEGILAELGAIALNYQDTPLKIINNGHTIQVNYATGSTMTVNGESFDLAQFHFHHPSEHHVMGQAFPMEMHLVHRNAAGRLAVLGVFLKEGTSHPTLQRIWDAIPAETGVEQVINDVSLNAAQLLPEGQAFYEYHGSLTTPPCSEGVLWLVMQQPIEVSAQQIQRFAQIFPLNARPVQPLNNRFVLQSE